MDPDLERRANRAWNLLMMVILEMLARAYKTDRQEIQDLNRFLVDPAPVHQLAVETYERGLGLYLPESYKEVNVGQAEEIPDGSRKIVQIEDLSIGIFHHKGEWIALRNHCLHVGGPVATGLLEDDTLVCPWHGFRYCVLNGELLIDPALKLDRYEVTQRNGQVFVKVPDAAPKKMPLAGTPEPAPTETKPRLKPNEFLVDGFPEGNSRLVYLDNEAVAVFLVNGQFYATSDSCTHAGGPLSEGKLDGQMVICPWHSSCFDVTNGEVLCGPAEEPLKTFKVILEGNVGRVE
jgi:nitrite reductase/ring-hydroxylating ferredoxin subunit